MKDNFTILPGEFSAAKIKKSFSRVAPVYDLWSKLTESKATARALELARIRDGEQILEVAAGTGLVFEQIVERNKNGQNV